MDRFDAMRAYVNVVDSGSFTRAARQLGIHKATVSQQVQQLEARLGTRLLTRTTRSVSPTAEGRAYHERACAILQQLDEAESALRRASAGPQGLVRVEVPVAMGRLVLAPALREFLAICPGVTVELGCTDRVVDLIGEGIDCALRGGELPDSGLVSRPVGALRFGLYAAPHHLAPRAPLRTPDDLRRAEQVGYVLTATGRRRPIRLLQAGQAVEVEVPARLVTTDSAAALAAALDGLGIVQLADFVAAPHVDQGRLQRVLPDWRCPSLPMQWVTPTARGRTARVQAFMDWAHALVLRRLSGFLDEAPAPRPGPPAPAPAR